MKIATFLLGSEQRYGEIRGNRALSASVGFRRRFATLRDVLLHNALDQLRDDLASQPDRHGVEEISFLPPIPARGKIICVGMNYPKPYPVDGVAPPVPDNVILFGREHDTVAGHGQLLEIPPGDAAKSFDFEGEIAVVIGKAGRHIPVSVAMDHVLGYSVFNDGSVREWQRHSIYAGKNFNKSGSWGPWITTADEVSDPAALRLTTLLNGEEMQSALASEMIFPIAEQIAYASQLFELKPGDVIATGSPDGTGGSRNPKRYLVPGDKIEVSVSGVGCLTSFVP